MWQVLTRPTMGTTLRLVGGAADRDPGTVMERLRDVADELDALAAVWTRFDPSSHLERLNDDPRTTVAVDPRLGHAVRAALWCRARSRGLVDPTLGAALVAAGYDRTFSEIGGSGAIGHGPTSAPRRPPAVRVAPDGRAVTRPPGVRLDLGGTAKGLAADLAAARLRDLDRYAVDLGGDVRVGGTRRDVPQEVRVTTPERRVATLSVDRGAVATSSVLKRVWRTADGSSAHHLLDPRTARPACTGVVQASALARTALEAELLAKQALLEGPVRGAALLRSRHGGVLVHAGGRVEEVVA